MPDFLPPDLQAQRQQVADLATTILVPLRDDPLLTPESRAAQVRSVSQAAGLYALTQTDTTPELTLLVLRETLAQHGVGQIGRAHV